MSKNTSRILGIGVLFLVIIGCYYLYQSLVGAEKMTKRKLPPTNVEVTKVKQEQWQPEIEATGTLSAFQGIMVKSEVSGRVTKIYIHSGEDVKKGDPLIQVYPDILKADLEKAEADLAYATSDFNRKKELYEKKVLSKDDFDKAKAIMDRDAGQVAQVRAQLGQNLVKAPFSGRLGLKQVDLGDYLSPGQEIINLQALDPMRIDFRIPQNYLAVLALNQKVDLTSDAFPNKDFSGKVYAFDSAVETASRTIGVRAYIPNPNKQLLPGTFAEVKLFAGKKHTVLVIPQTAVAYSPTGDYVYVVEKSKAVKKDIKIGSRRGTEVSVLDGLKVGDTVITSGQVKLFNGSPVVIGAEMAKKGLTPYGTPLPKGMMPAAAQQGAKAPMKQDGSNKNAKSTNKPANAE